MSRSGYTDDCENNWDLIRWRGAVTSAIKGRRGQSFLKEMLAALDALHAKRLIAGDLLGMGGEVCALGSVGAQRGVDMTKLDPYDRETVAGTFGISPALAAEIMYINDDFWQSETPERRWQRVRNWVVASVRDQPN